LEAQAQAQAALLVRPQTRAMTVVSMWTATARALRLLLLTPLLVPPRLIRRQQSASLSQAARSARAARF
jgi:hypothetical protein